MKTNKTNKTNRTNRTNRTIPIDIDEIYQIKKWKVLWDLYEDWKIIICWTSDSIVKYLSMKDLFGIDNDG